MTAVRRGAELDAGGFMETVEAALDTGTVDIARLLESVDMPDGQGWYAFLDRVEQGLAGLGRPAR